ncbi:hypothetical protein SAMN05444167_1138 [Terriglobus roseus]|uniref:Ig-like domain-containing protein n=1 Tax=Terriglobus roseus TaxID=392734 RepID=A0A1G7HMC0_9BACT|nr:hypothetical protein SAMN05444167_1138 [Terriglobus roseus]
MPRIRQIGVLVVLFLISLATSAQMGTYAVITTVTVSSPTILYGTGSIAANIITYPALWSGPVSGATITCTLVGLTTGTSYQTVITDGSGLATLYISSSMSPDSYTITCHADTYPFSRYSGGLSDNPAYFRITNGDSCTSATDVSWIDSDNTPFWINWDLMIDATPSVPGQDGPTKESGYGFSTAHGNDCSNNPITTPITPPTVHYNGWHPQADNTIVGTWTITSHYYYSGTGCTTGNCQNSNPGSDSMSPDGPYPYRAFCD